MSSDAASDPAIPKPLSIFSARSQICPSEAFRFSPIHRRRTLFQLPPCVGMDTFASFQAVSRLSHRNCEGIDINLMLLKPLDELLWEYVVDFKIVRASATLILLRQARPPPQNHND